MSSQLHQQLREAFPGYKLNSFLGGTQNKGALKWTMGNHICEKGCMVGFLGPKSARLLQTFSQWRSKRYFSHVSPFFNRNGALSFVLCLWDREVRKALWKRLASLVTRPQTWFKKLYLQTFIVMQPMDFLEAGGQDHCDGCPNMTMYKGKLIRGCEVEAHLEFGGPFQTVPKELPEDFPQNLPKNLKDLPGLFFPSPKKNTGHSNHYVGGGL